MSLASTLLLSANTNLIDQYIFNQKHQGKISAIWFKQPVLEQQFVESLCQSSLGLGSFYCKVDSKDLESVKSLLHSKIEKQELRILILHGESDHIELQEMILDINFNYGITVFLINDHLSTTYITDKVICVGENGAVADEFSTEIMV